MTVEELKRLSVAEQKQIFGLFYSSYCSATRQEIRAKYLGSLMELRTIFGLDTATYGAWMTACAQRQAAIRELLGFLMNQKAA